MTLYVMLLFGAIVFFLFSIFFRTVRVRDKSEGKSPPDYDRLKAEHAALSLSSLIRFRTVRGLSGSGSAFGRMADYLRARYADTFETLTVEDIGENMVLRWKGSNEDADPVLFCVNTDVLSADGVWEYSPFSGEIAENMVWGRGAIESKGVLCAMMEAADNLVRSGFAPVRDVYLALVCDGESGNDYSEYAGSREVADTFRRRGIRFSAVFGKGNCISRDMLPIRRPQAVIGVAEKGMVKMRLCAEDKGGRSGMPPNSTLIASLCEAVCRAEFRMQPIRKSVLLMDMIAGFTPHLPFRERMLAANLWVFEPVFFRSMGRYKSFSSMFRTTITATEIKAGSQESKLPTSGEATLTIRTIHGDTCSDICRFLMSLIDSLGVRAEVVQAEEASQISPYRGSEYIKLQRALIETFGSVVTVPGIVAGNSSLNMYRPYADSVYQITPFVLTEDEISTVHGINERIGIEALGRAVIFYEKLLNMVAG